MQRLLARTVFVACLAAAPLRAASFDLQFSISDPNGFFTPTKLAILNEALVHVERMWETVIAGYQPGISIPAVPITVQPVNSGLASASFSGSTNQGGYQLATSGFINVNYNEVENFANWQGPGANGLNFIDELLAHETGHVLGVGTLWSANGVYSFNSFQYTGAHGVAAYEAEFSDSILYAPVENAGNPGTPNAHWDQRMRSSDPSSPDHGDPTNPWALSPLVGVVDPYGRDRALELMTGAIDPDFREPYIARFTVQSMRDMGYKVTEFEDFNGDGAVNMADLSVLKTNFGATGLQIDSMAFGDADRDRDVDGQDLLLWQIRLGQLADVAQVPEPAAGALAILASTSLFSRLRRTRLLGPAT
jgi:hypothetical protein